MTLPDPSASDANSIRLAVDTWAKTLALALQDARQRFAQMGDRGDDVEGAFRRFLSGHLPPRFRIGQGEVIDSKGRRSLQTDVIVTDDEQPFPVDDKPQLLIIEGVTAGAEVKTRLTIDGLADAITKGRQFKQLEVVPGKWTALAGETSKHGQPNSDLARFYRHRPYFLFAYESDIAEDRLQHELAAANTLDEIPALDAVFILAKGFAVNLWDGHGGLCFENQDGEVLTGWLWEGDAAKVLPFLLMWLHGVMPRFSIRSSALLPYMFPTRYDEAAPSP